MLRKDVYFNPLDMLWHIFSDVPNAVAYIRGSDQFPQISGAAQFYQLPQGVLVVVEIMGIPMSVGSCRGGIHALHIHEGKSCSGTAADPFADAGMHYNPADCEHPFHAGDLPPIFESDGYGLSVFFTNRFDIEEVIGKTLIVHENIDDFSTQPSGNAGAKIACGEISQVMVNL